MKTSFPDKKFLNKLLKYSKKKADISLDVVEQLLIYSGASLNWIGDYVTDKNAQWTKEKLNIDRLYLTGTNPKWNAIIIDRCKRSPQKLREYFIKNKGAKKLFAEAKYQNLPILIRYEDNQYKVLDGMHRTIAAIRDGKKEINAYIVRLKSRPRPQCEAHLVYDLLRSYNRGINKDKNGLVSVLRFLRHSYSNVDDLLRKRFSKPYIPGDDEIQDIIKISLKD